VGERWLYVGGARAAQIVDSADEEKREEQLPVPSADECKPLIDDPQSILSVEIFPIDRPGQTDLKPNELPPDCPAPVLAGVPTIFMVSVTACGWPEWPGAQFCHRPLYFEERCLERCGQKQCCCQPAASAAHFFGTAILLPVEFCCQCPGDCVCTPSEF
jgi:hypothetical protein